MNTDSVLFLCSLWAPMLTFSANMETKSQCSSQLEVLIRGKADVADTLCSSCVWDAAIRAAELLTGAECHWNTTKVSLPWWHWGKGRVQTSCKSPWGGLIGCHIAEERHGTAPQLLEFSKCPRLLAQTHYCHQLMRDESEQVIVPKISKNSFS